jgi:hypothetical protein
VDQLNRERRGRFLNHLLARFGEVIDAYGATWSGDFTGAQESFLQQLPWLGSARGTAFDYLRPSGPDNRSALEQRVRLKLGLTGDEACLLVEHVLLRPTPDDHGQSTALLAAANRRDPYSLQLTFVFLDGVGRFDGTDASHAPAEQVVRSETPAHLTPYALWLSQSEYQAVSDAHDDWLSARRTYVAQNLNIDLTKL